MKSPRQENPPWKVLDWMKCTTDPAQRGIALALTLIMLGIGSLVIVPTLRYASTALFNQQINRDDFWTINALDAITELALWELQHDDDFLDCSDALGNPVLDSDGTNESFVDCVVSWGSWTLATSGKLESIENETLVAQVNRQDVSVKVEVPADLLVAPDPSPTPTSDKCLYVWVTRDTDLAKAGDQTWVLVNEPIYYTLHIWYCSDGPEDIKLRRIHVLMPEDFIYELGSTGGDATFLDPERSACDGSATTPDPDYTPCTITDNRRLLSWPSATTNWAGSSTISVGVTEVWEHTFTATPSSWGVFFIEALVCYWDSGTGAPGPCISGKSHGTGKVAPIVVGMFNIQGNGQGNAFGAIAKLDDGGSDLIGIDPL